MTKHLLILFFALFSGSFAMANTDFSLDEQLELRERALAEWNQIRQQAITTFKLQKSESTFLEILKSDREIQVSYYVKELVQNFSEPNLIITSEEFKKYNEKYFNYLRNNLPSELFMDLFLKRIGFEISTHETFEDILKINTEI